MSKAVKAPSTTLASPFDEAVEAVRGGRPVEDVARTLYEQLTDAEQLALLDGDVDFWSGLLDMLTAGYNRQPLTAGSVARLGVPGIRFTDGPRGVVVGASTAFPVSTARGATWDTSLEESVGRAMGAEARAQGANFFAGVCVNLPRHPAWGRYQETYGEDPVLLGEMGAAMVRGVQQHVMACVKHFALNSIENSRHQVDVTVQETDLHEVYLPHFRRIVEQGVAAVMTAYNSVNGEFCGQNPVLLSDILRHDWGFDGITVSDFVMGIRDPVASLAAGLDVELPYRQQRAQQLPTALADGRASWSDVERAGLHILTTQISHASAVIEPEPGRSVVAGAEHRRLAREVALRSMVVLRNESVGDARLLPFDESSLTSLAIIGPLADAANMGDHGSSDVRAPSVSTPLSGLRAALPGIDVRHASGGEVADAASLAAQCDIALVVVGYTGHDEGEYFNEGGLSEEAAARYFPPLPGDLSMDTVQAALSATIKAGAAGGDRTSLSLHVADEELIRAVAAANPRTVVAIVASGPVLIHRWHEHVPAIVMAWYAGMEGGNALADLLLGRPGAASGRLPYAIPASDDHLPEFPSAPRTITYARLYGQRLLDSLGQPALYPLGGGLSYTAFTASGMQAERSDDETCMVRVNVRNEGGRPGIQVVQVYGSPLSGDRTHERALLGFTTISLAPGETGTATVKASLRPLGRWMIAAHRLDIPVEVRLEIANDAAAPALQTFIMSAPTPRRT